MSGSQNDRTSRPACATWPLALNHKYAALDRLRRHKEALSVITEAVRRYRDLFAEDPAVYLFSLAMVLNNQSVAFAAMRQYDEALTAANEAVAHFEHIMEDQRTAELCGRARQTALIS